MQKLQKNYKKMSNDFQPGNLIALYNLNNRNLLSSCPTTCWSWSINPGRTFSLVKNKDIKLDRNDIFRIHDMGEGTIGFEPLTFPGTLIFPYDGSSTTFGHFNNWNAPQNATWRQNIQRLKPIFSNVPLSQRSSIARFRAEKRANGYYIRHVNTGLLLTISSGQFPLVPGISTAYPHLRQECTQFCFGSTQLDTWMPIVIDKTKCCMGIDDLHSSQEVCDTLWQNPAVCDQHMIQFCTNNPDSSYCTCLTSPIKQFNPLCVDGECLKGGYVTQNMTKLPCPNVIDCTTQILLGEAGRDISLGQNQIIQNCGRPPSDDTNGGNDIPPIPPAPPASNPVLNQTTTILVLIFLLVLFIALMGGTVYYYYGRGEKIVNYL